MNKLLALTFVLLIGALVTVPAAHAQTGVVKGKVTDEATGLPISGWPVTLYLKGGTAQKQICTSVDGTWALTNVATGTYEVYFAGDGCPANGYAAEWFDNRYSRENAAPIAIVDGQETANINGALSAAEATVAGTVTEAATGAPVENITVRLLDVAGVTLQTRCSAADGGYRFGNLGPGVFSVSFLATVRCDRVGLPRFTPQFYKDSDTQAGAMAVNLALGVQATGIDAHLKPLQFRRLTITPLGTGVGKVISSPGGISCPPFCSADFPVGTSVMLEARETAPSTFTSWSGCTSIGTGLCELIIDGDRSVGARFTPPGGEPIPDGGGGGDNGGNNNNNNNGGGTTTTPGTTTPTTTPTTTTTTDITRTLVPSGPTPRCTLTPAKKVEKGKLKLTIKCDRKATFGIAGTLKFKKGNRTTTLRVSTPSYKNVAKRTATIKLPARARTAMRKKLKVSARLELVVTSGGAPTRSVKTIPRLRA